MDHVLLTFAGGLFSSYNSKYQGCIWFKILKYIYEKNLVRKPSYVRNVRQMARDFMLLHMHIPIVVLRYLPI